MIEYHKELETRPVCKKDMTQNCSVEYTEQHEYIYIGREHIWHRILVSQYENKYSLPLFQIACFNVKFPACVKDDWAPKWLESGALFAFKPSCHVDALLPTS